MSLCYCGDCQKIEARRKSQIIEELERENARLREALEFIRSGCLAPPDGGSPCLDDAISAARAALEGK